MLIVLLGYCIFFGNVNGGVQKPAPCLSVSLLRTGLPYMGCFRDLVNSRDADEFSAIARIRESELKLVKLQVPGLLTTEARLLLAHTVLDSNSIRGANIAAGGLALFSKDSVFNPDTDVW